jgi:hypothetical protein
MYAEIDDSSLIGAVGTTFSAHYPDGKPTDLGWTYRQPRNTMMLVDLHWFNRVGNYNPICDSFKGMEDVQWCARLLKARGLVEMLDLKVPLMVGVNHVQSVKETNEADAIAKNQAHFPELAEEFEELLAYAKT